MRRRDKELRDPEEIEDVLRRAQVIRIAICDNGKPYCIPMSFGYCNGFIYLHSAKEGRKLDLLRRNNLVCFEAEVDVEPVEAEKPCKWTMRYKCVIGIAEAHFVTEKEERRRALSCIFEHYSGRSYEFADEELENVEVIRLEIMEISGKKSPI